MTHTLVSLEKMRSRFAPTVIGSDLSNLSPANRLALAKIVQAARLMNDIQDRQSWQDAPAMRATLESDKSAIGQSRLKYFHLNGGPWSALDHHKPFIDGVPERPAKANFYPSDLTAEEFDGWLKGLDEGERAKATGFFHVIRRDRANKLITVPFS